MSSIDTKKFTAHRPVDPSDPGFVIPGAKLRWISGRVRETSSSSGIWKALKKSELSEKLVAHIEDHYPGAFSHGDTIRRGNGELILAYAPLEAVAKHRAYLDQENRNQSSKARIMPNQEDVGHKNDFAKLETYEKSASSIPSQFLKTKQSE